MNLPVLNSRSDCTRCDLHQQTLRSVGVPTVRLPHSLKTRPDHPAVFVLGMNPGQKEDAANKPFVGPSGTMLRHTYLGGEDSISSSASIYLGNAVRCWTPLDAQPKSRHYKACWSHTLQDLTSIRAAHDHQILRILCLGVPASKIALRELCGRKTPSFSKLLRSQGTPSTCNRYLLYFTFHPAAVLRNPNLVHAVADHMQILHDSLCDRRPLPSSPQVVPPRAPRI